MFDRYTTGDDITMKIKQKPYVINPCIHHKNKNVRRTTMKTLFILLSTLLVVSSFTQTIGASPSIIVYDYTLDPEVFMPGDTGILTLTLKNAETTATRTSTSDSTTTTSMIGATINNIWIIPAKSNNRELRAHTNYEDVGYLAPGTSIPIRFKLSADKEIPEGYYFPTVRIDVETYTDVRYPIVVQVSNSTVELIQTSVPSVLSRSGSTQITFTVINNRPASVHNVFVYPAHQVGIQVFPEKIYVGELAAGASKDITFSLTPSEKGEQNVTFYVDYKNGQNLHTSMTYVSFDVIETDEVAPIFTSFPRSITKGGSAKIRLEVYNAKTEKITGVLITPICDSIVVPSQYFIGEMDPDDVFSASFDIFTTNVDYGNHTISFIVTYKQGNLYYETGSFSKTFEVVQGAGTNYQAQSSSGSLSGTPEQPSGVMCLTTFIIILVVILLFVILFIRWKKRRKA